MLVLIYATIAGIYSFVVYKVFTVSFFQECYDLSSVKSSDVFRQAAVGPDEVVECAVGAEVTNLIQVEFAQILLPVLLRQLKVRFVIYENLLQLY